MYWGDLVEFEYDGKPYRGYFNRVANIVDPPKAIVRVGDDYPGPLLEHTKHRVREVALYAESLTVISSGHFKEAGPW